MNVIPAWVFGAAASAGVLIAAHAVARRRRAKTYVDRAFELVRDGRPGRARALLRLAARIERRGRDARAVLCEALALFWQGSFDAALGMSCLASAEAEAEGAAASEVGAQGRAIAVLALVFGEEVGGARVLYDLASTETTSTSIRELTLPYVGAIVSFHERRESGTVDDEAFEEAGVLGVREAHGALATFHLAARAHAAGDADRARELLSRVHEEAGHTFVRRWARHQLEALGPPRARLTPTKDPAFDALDLFRVPLFHPDAIRRVTPSAGRAALLVLVCAALIFARALAQITEIEPFSAEQFGRDLLPIGAVAFASGVGLLGLRARHGTRLRFVTACFTAMPALVLGCVAASATPWGAGAFGFLAVWGFVLTLALVRSVSPAGWLRALVTSSLVVGGFTAAMLFFPPTRSYLPPELEDELTALRDSRAVLKMRRERFEQKDEAMLVADEAALLPERAGTTDLYFVSFAGYGAQRVFAAESRYARDLFDERFDTRGRSIVLANEVGHTAQPRANRHTLHRTLAAIGKRMNPKEDVLFLYLTSHGDQNGLAIFDGESSTLSPADLRSALDDAGILHRIVIVAGCESGVFLEPLQTPTSLVATAASTYRSSYGCSDTRSFTEYGERVFRDHLAHGEPFVAALTRANDDTIAAETARGAALSHPRLSVGNATATKLAELEDRLDLR